MSQRNFPLHGLLYGLRRSLHDLLFGSHLPPDKRHHAHARQHVLPREPFARDAVGEVVETAASVRFTQVAHEHGDVRLEHLLVLPAQVTHQPEKSHTRRVK